jgi:Protein-tyrosine-phosphatase
MGKTKVLFICVHNSGRSLMAEAFLNRYGGEEFQVESAGLEPTEINPLVVEVMAEEGIDLAGKKTQSVFDLFRVGRLFDYVITVCDDANEAKCPVFPGVTHRWHWPFPDPSKLSGTREEQLAQLRVIRNQIKDQVLRPFKTPFRTQDTFAS